MATRSIKLRLLVPRDESAQARQARTAIWATHEFVNFAADRYANLLLELRQEDVCVGLDDQDKDIVESKAIWQARLSARLQKNGVQAEQIPLALPLLKRLYGEIIPSVLKKGAGDAQVANGFASPLVDKESVGGEAKAAKGIVLAGLVLRRGEPVADWAEDARAIVLANRATLIEAPGRKKAWAVAWLADSTGTDWLEKLKKELDVLAKEATDGTTSVLPEARRRGLLPLMPAVGSGRVANLSGGVLSKHERTGLANAAAALNAWESKRFDMQESRDRLQGHLDTWDNEFGLSHREALAAVRAFEIEETARLRLDSLADGDTDYRIGPRELRTSWLRLREWLQKHPHASAETREAHVRALQTELGRDFGSHRLLSWLAAPAQQWLAAHPAGDVIQRIAVRNVRQRKHDRARSLPRWTGADAVLHPRFATFDPPANTNAPGFELRHRPDGGLEVVLSLLAPNAKANGLMAATDFPFLLVPSRQIDRPQLTETRNDKGKRLLHLGWREQSGTAASGGELGGSALLLSRQTIEHRPLGRLQAGEFGPVWFKLSVDLGADKAAAFKAGKKVSAWLNAGIAKRLAADAKNTPPAPGTRILAVDLGLRTAVSLSVWRIDEASAGQQPSRKQASPWRVEIGQGLVAVHERSAMLALPGEAPDPEIVARRLQTNLSVRQLLASISHMGGLSRACRAEAVESRNNALDVLGEAEDPKRARATVRTTEHEISQLRALVSAEHSAWRVAAEPIWKRVESDLAKEIQKWRREQRAQNLRTRGGSKPRDSEAQSLEIDNKVRATFGPGHGPSDSQRLRRDEPRLGGKSAWQIEHIELVRKVLLRWHSRQRPEDTRVRRLGFKEMGKFAGRLLDHLTRLKEDRTKSTAALIVSAARGLVRETAVGPKGRPQDREQWTQRFEPCSFIVMEDLGRYRFKTDRPRAENRQLMQWAHREVRRLVEMQAEVHGIGVVDTGAAFSSKFDARTGAPGVRCAIIDAAWLARLVAGELPYAAKILEELGVAPADLRPGQVLPTGSGEQLVSLDASGRLRVRHADLNAAQGLALRALTGHATVFRLSMRRILVRPGVHVFVNARKVLALLSGALQQELGLATPAQVAVLTPLGAIRHKLAAYVTPRAAAAELGLDLARLSAAGGTDEAEEGGDVAVDDADPDVVTFFRDPTGNVHAGTWVEAKLFWGEVNKKVIAALRSEGKFGPKPVQIAVHSAVDPDDDIPL